MGRDMWCNIKLFQGYLGPVLVYLHCCKGCAAAHSSAMRANLVARSATKERSS